MCRPHKCFCHIGENTLLVKNFLSKFSAKKFSVVQNIQMQFTCFMLCMIAAPTVVDPATNYGAAANSVPLLMHAGTRNKISGHAEPSHVCGGTDHHAEDPVEEQRRLGRSPDASDGTGA